MSAVTAKSVPPLAGLSALAPRYEALLCDVWGVVHDGRRAHRGAVDALQRFREEAGPVVLITNSPRPASEIARDLDRLHVPGAAYDAVVSSGDVTRALIRARAARPLHWIGPERDRPLFEGLDVRFAPAEEAGAVIVTGLEDDDETPAVYAGRLERWHALGLPMICANPDIVVEQGDRLVWCGGALGEDYRRIGGEVMMAGKPYAPIYERARELIDKAAGRPVPTASIMAVGDSVRTDLAGAATVGIDVVFIISALHADELEKGDGEARAVAELVAPTGASVPGYMPALIW